MGQPEHGSNDTAAVLAGFDQLPMMAATMEGPELRVTAINAVLRGIVDHDVVGETIEEAVPELAGQLIVDHVREVYATGVPFAGSGWRLESPGPDGELLERFLDLSWTPLRRSDGTIHGILAIALDVTDAVRARQAIDAETAGLQARYEQARDTVTMLQQALLPNTLPVLPGLDLSARYLLAEVDTSAGGDWFDTLVFDDGRVAVMAGDVVGHGVQASAVMGQLRSALRLAMRSSADPAEAIAQLDTFSHTVPGAAAATVCTALIDPSNGNLTYCTAGHPPPLIASLTGDARYVEPSGGSPLGVNGEYANAAEQLDVDDVLLLYTDGIIERPNRDPSQATLELLKATRESAAGRAFTLSAPARAAERVTQQVLELLTRPTGHSDDITLIAAHRRTPVEPFTRTGPAVARAVPEWRHEFEPWLQALGIEPVVDIGVTTAVVELITNAVEHAYFDETSRGEPPGDMTLTARLEPTGTLQLEVRDHGRWTDPELPVDDTVDRGRGLALTGALVDELTVDRADTGTTVTARATLTTAPRIVTAADSRPLAPSGEFTADADDRTLRVSGPIDIATARAFDHALRDLGRHATTPVAVDLSAVTHLASAGVQALADALRRHTTNGIPLTLHAPVGSPAQHILALTHLPHVNDGP